METFAEHVERLRAAREKASGTRFSQQRLITEAASYRKPGTASDTIRDAVRARKKGLPSMVVIEVVAQALGAKAEDFAAYRIQQAQRRLDHKAVGMASALASADLLLSLPLPEQVATTAGQRRARNPAAASRSARTRKAKDRAS